MVHRRLAIIHTSPAGHEPMLSHNGRYVLTYNGEIYNYRELREQLRSLGHQFRTGTDAEVLLRRSLSGAGTPWTILTACLPSPFGIIRNARSHSRAITLASNLSTTPSFPAGTARRPRSRLVRKSKQFLLRN